MQTSREAQIDELERHLTGAERYGVEVAHDGSGTIAHYDQETNRLRVGAKALERSGSASEPGYVVAQHNAYHQLAGYLMLGGIDRNEQPRRHPRAGEPTVPPAILEADTRTGHAVLVRTARDFADERLEMSHGDGAAATALLARTAKHGGVAGVATAAHRKDLLGHARELRTRMHEAADRLCGRQPGHNADGSRRQAPPCEPGWERIESGGGPITVRTDGDGVICRRRSIASGRTNQMRLATDIATLHRWERGQNIQAALPALSPDEREFLLSGATAEEWTELMGSEDGEADEGDE